MSDNWLILIPQTTGLVPPAAAIPQAKSYLQSSLPDADEIEAEVSEHLRFVHCGSNFETVRCPHTGKEIDKQTWAAAMDRADQTNFEDLSFTSPHSGRKTSLADLIYDWPQGFARFTLTATNPNVTNLPNECQQGLEERLNCQLTTIRRHI